MSFDSLSQRTQNGDFGSISAAADLIKSIDSAFSAMTSNALTAAKEAEDARKNARVASEIARLFSSGGNRSSSEDSAPGLLDSIPVFVSSMPSEPGGKLSPPPPPSSKLSNGGPIPVFGKQMNSSLRPDNENNTPASSPQTNTFSPSRRRRQHDRSAAERLARAHAEDVLSITLELEKAKQALEKEQMSHDETKSALMQAKEKNAQVEAQIEKLLFDMETHRENDGRKVDELEDELARAHYRVSAAEEDAQLALDLAKANAEQRQQLEAWLQRALEEIETLKGHIVMIESGGGQVNANATITSENSGLANNDSIISAEGIASPIKQNVSPFVNPPKAAVAAGRSLLKKSQFNESYDPESQAVQFSFEAAADRARHLRNRLKAFSANEEQILPPPESAKETSSSPPRRTPRNSLGSAVEALDVCRNTVDILKESGTRLNLTGRWWKGQNDTQLDEIHLESLARNFCTAVEVELDRKHKEIQELESLCALWEEGISNDDVETSES